MKYALTHVNLIDGLLNTPVHQNVTILVKDEKIENIIDGSFDEKEYKVIDLKGRYVMPGLINLHAHLFGTGKPAKSLGGGKSQEFLMKFIKTKFGNYCLKKMVISHVQNALYSGVTTMRGVGDFNYSDVLVRDMINSGKIVGPRLLVSGPAITVPEGHGAGTFADTAVTEEEFKKLVEERKKHNVDLIKICVTGGVMDAKVKGEPGILRMNLEQTKAVCDLAHKYGYQVASHTESEAGMEVAIKGGVDTIEHGSKMTPELIDLMKHENKSYIVTLSPALPLANLDPSITKLNELSRYNTQVLVKEMICGAKQAIDNGISIGLGTDASCPLVSQYNTWRELLYATKELGISNQVAIHLATLGNAKILKLNHETGSIEPKKFADLIVVDKNPYEDLNTLGKVEMVMIKGRLIKNPKVNHNKIIDNSLELLKI